MVAPGGHLLGEMDRRSRLAQEHPEFHDGFRYFLMSGTSQAAAVASGVAALILQENPNLTPDDVKCRLMASASVAQQADGSLAYSLFQQGAGLINAYAAVHEDVSGCANGGLDIAMDMSGEAHFGGPAGIEADGTYQISGINDKWTATGSKAESFIWNLSDIGSNGSFWNMSFIWNLSFLEQNGGVWSQTDFDSNGYYWDVSKLEEDGLVANFDDAVGSSFLWDLGHPTQSVKQLSQGSSDPSPELSDGYIWNMGLPDDLVMVWQMSKTETGSFIWNLSYLSNQRDSVTSSFIWNLGEAENVSFLWNLGEIDNESFLWNLSELSSSSFLWNLNETENASFLWNLAFRGDLEEIGAASINHWVEQE